MEEFDCSLPTRRLDAGAEEPSTPRSRPMMPAPTSTAEPSRVVDAALTEVGVDVPVEPPRDASVEPSPRRPR